MILGLVLSNLLYPVVAIGVAAVLCILIWLRHRRPKSVEANMRAFNKGLRALAPETRGSTATRGRASTTPVSTRLRPPAPTGLPVVPERPARIPPPSRPMATASPAPPPVTAMSGPPGPSDGAEAEAG